MTTVEIKVQRGGDKKLLRELRRLRKKIGNTTKVNRQVSVWLARWVDQNFKTQGGKVGGWKPFKIGGRRIRGGGIDPTAKLLQDTGTLRASYKPFHDRNVAGIGSDLPRSVYHELGLPARNLPARRMLPLDSDTSVQEGVFRIYDTFVKRAIR